MAGRGQVLAVGVKPLKVRYRLTIDRRDGVVSFLGSLKGNVDTIKAAWLMPVVTLRLEDGERIDVTITEIHQLIALFSQAL